MWIRSLLCALALTLPALAADPVDSARLPYNGSWEGLVGVEGGIPDRSGSIYATHDTGDTQAQIQASIDACPSGQAVLLEAGTYNWTSQLVIDDDGVTLLGETNANGVPTTILNWTADVNPKIYFGYGGWEPYTTGDWDHQIAVSSPTSNHRGVTSIVLGSTPTGLVEGQLAFVADSTTRTLWEVQWYSPSQGVIVTNISGTTVEFEPPLQYASYSGTLTFLYEEGGGFVYQAGLENLELTANEDNDDGVYVRLENTDQCFLKNLKIGPMQGGGEQYMVENYGSHRVEIRDCEFETIQTLGTSTYAIQTIAMTQARIEGNYLHDIPNVFPFVLGGLNVVAYNYVDDLPYSTDGWLSQIAFSHNSHTYMNLFEGNWVAQSYNDPGGTTYNWTWLRNRMRGWDSPTRTSDTVSNGNPMFLWDTHWNVTMAGNVLGEDGYHSTYYTTSTGGNPNANIYVIHSTVASTFEKFGNYNTIDDGINASETVGGGDAIVDSYLYSSKPAYFKDLPWPWVDTSNFSQSNDPESFPAGYRAINGVFPTSGGGGGSGSATFGTFTIGL